jgi:hypothetical protein
VIREFHCRKVAGINLYWNICREKDRKISFSNLVTVWYAIHVFRFRIEHTYAENSGWVWEKKIYAVKGKEFKTAF